MFLHLSAASLVATTHWHFKSKVLSSRAWYDSCDTAVRSKSDLDLLS
jgi:hypothetical protein